MNRTIRAAVISILLFAISALPASSQTNTASVSGKISDPSGALIPGVTVTATNTDTQAVAKIVTNSDGKYGFSGLQPGSYSVLASLRGFNEASAQKVLGSGESVELNFKLTIGVAPADDGPFVIRPPEGQIFR